MTTGENIAENTSEEKRPGKEQIDIKDFMKLDLRVAQIIEAEKVEKSEKLIRLQVDLGEAYGTRQLVAGIASFHEPENLIGQKIVVVANLKPAKLMGVESNGMILAAGGREGFSFGLLQPAGDVELGAPVC